MSLKEVRKRSKKFYFKLKEHVPLINPYCDVISGIVVKRNLNQKKLKKAGFSPCDFCYFDDTPKEKDSLPLRNFKISSSRKRRDGKNVFFSALKLNDILYTKEEKVDLMF